MPRFYTSYRPGLTVPSYEDPIFDRDIDEIRIPDKEESETMFLLVNTLLDAVPFFNKDGYSVISTKDGSMEKIKMAYGEHDGYIEVTLYSDYVEFVIHRQNGYELNYIVERCLLAIRKAVGYFAYCDDDIEPPYDPIERQDEISPITIENFEKRLALSIYGERKKLAWWKFWEK